MPVELKKVRGKREEGRGKEGKREKKEERGIVRTATK